MNIAFAGSFDPPTKGHLWMMREAAKIGHLTVLIGENPDKKYMFGIERRVELVIKMLEAANIEGDVEVLRGEYTAEWAARNNARLIRGIRNGTDFEYEQKLNYSNVKQIAAEQTLFVIPPEEVAVISSSYVKSFIGPIGWHHKVKTLLTKNVYQFLTTNWLRLQYYDAVRNIQELVYPSPSHEDIWGMFYGVLERYQQEDRYHHGVEHIIHIISELSREELTHIERSLLVISAFYHDYFNGTQWPEGVTDERASANIARRDMEILRVSREHVEAIWCIVASTEYGVDHQLSGEVANIAPILHCADLAILGRPRKEYQDYATNIRLEYAYVPAEEYIDGRSKVLQLLLNKAISGELFACARFDEAYNKAAIANLTWELEFLDGVTNSVNEKAKDEDNDS